jgi:hypothetical protein
MALLEHTSTGSGPFYAFPASQAPSFANWLTKRVQLTGSNGYFSGTVNTTLDGSRWFVFEGASAPASFDAYVAYADFAIEEIPKYGDPQTWTNPTETLAVTVSRGS